MSSFLKTLIPLLSSLPLLLALATWPARAQTTSFTYDFYGSQPTDLTYQGDAHFPTDMTYLRLTNTGASGNALTGRTGRVLYSNPIQFRKAGAQADLETTVKFIIKPNDGDANPGDGLAFFIGPVGSSIGAAGGSFGIFDDSGKKAGVFAVEFDIFVNGVDPRYRHVGIHIESQVSSNVTRVDDAILGQEVTARINYVGATKGISVHVTAGGSRRFEVSYAYDLSRVLDQQVQVGISAATGGRAATFDVISWYFTSTLVHATANGEEEGGNIRQFV